MYTSIAGVYRNGHIELLERPQHLKEEVQVIVTFLDEAKDSGEIDLRAHGINAEQADELRSRLAPFAEDWNSPEMDIYDNYDAARIAR